MSVTIIRAPFVVVVICDAVILECCINICKLFKFISCVQSQTVSGHVTGAEGGGGCEGCGGVWVVMCHSCIKLHTENCAPHNFWGSVDFDVDGEADAEADAVAFAVAIVVAYALRAVFLAFPTAATVAVAVHPSRTFGLRGTF